MEWYEILIMILAVILLMSIFFLGFRILRYKNTKKIISNIIKEKYPDINLKMYKQDNIYQFEFETDKRYLIKLLDINPKNEVIITNSEKVVINDDIKGWKRSTKPNFVAGIKEFIKMKNAIKIVLIYPDCHNITKYINESDVFLAAKFQKIDGLYYIRFGELIEFLNKQ